MARISCCRCWRRRYFGCRTQANIAAAIAVVVLLPTAIALLVVGTTRAVNNFNGGAEACGCRFDVSDQQLIASTNSGNLQTAAVQRTFTCDSVDALNCFNNLQRETYKNAMMGGAGVVLLLAALIPLFYFVTCSQRPDVVYEPDEHFLNHSAPAAKPWTAPSQQHIHQAAFASSNV